MNSNLPLTFRHLNLAFFLLVAAVPLLLGVGYALLYSLGLTGLINQGFTWANWTEVLGSRTFWQTLGFSFFVAMVTMILSVVLALSAVLWAGDQFQKGILSFLIYLPLVFPAMVMAFYTFQLLSKAGLLSRLSYQLGWIDNLQTFPDWVNDPYGIGIIFAHVLMATPFFIILFLNLYQNERLADYVGVAASLGASAGQIRRRVEAPVLLRRGSATLVLYFIFVMGSYEIPLLVGSQSPEMISVLTIRKLQRFNLGDIPQAYVMSVVYTFFVIGLLILSFRRRDHD